MLNQDRLIRLSLFFPLLSMVAVAGPATVSDVEAMPRALQAFPADVPMKVLSKTQQQALRELFLRFSEASEAEVSTCVAELTRPDLDGPSLKAKDKQAFLEALPWALEALVSGTAQANQVAHLALKDGRSLAVNNETIAQKLRADYLPGAAFSRHGFQELFDTLKAKGTFAVSVDDKGLAVTSGVEAHVNAQMSVMRWCSDTVWITRELLAVEKPEACPKALVSLAKVYLSQEDMFKRIILDPSPYHRGGKLDGIAHIFDGATFKLNEDFNRRRLEGHGLALKAFADAIKEGLVDGRPSGFQPSMLKGDDFKRVLDAMAYLADYFNAIRYYDSHTRTTGNWEEMPFERSMWDTTAVTLAFESVQDLLINPAYDANTQVQAVRAELRQRSTLLGSPAAMQGLIQRGWEAVRAYYPCENASRAFDASAVWTAAFAKLDADPLEDVRKRATLLRLSAETLLGEFGMRRYNGDSYLSTNYEHMSLFDNQGRLHLPGASKGGFEANDVSDEASFAARGALLVKGQEAQWVLPVPVMAVAYSRLLNQVLDLQKTQGENHELKAILLELWNNENYFIARTFAAVTPESYVKSNGRKGAPWALPEAYESITRLQGSRFEDRYGFMVGANTPLTWTVANAFDAFQRFGQDQVRMGVR